MVRVVCTKAGVGQAVREFSTVARAIVFARRVNRSRTFARVVS